MEAVIKSNTERIRSDVTQAVRADSTPGGMQKPSAEKLSVPQKKFPAPTPYPPYPLPPSSVNVPTSRALLSRQTDIQYDIVLLVRGVSVCTSVSVCMRRTCNQTRWLSGLV